MKKDDGWPGADCANGPRSLRRSHSTSSAGLQGRREQGLMPIRQGSNGKGSDRKALRVICLGAIVFAGGCAAPGSARTPVSKSRPTTRALNVADLTQSSARVETTAKVAAATAAPGRV